MLNAPPPYPETEPCERARALEAEATALLPKADLRRALARASKSGRIGTARAGAVVRELARTVAASATHGPTVVRQAREAVQILGAADALRWEIVGHMAGLARWAAARFAPPELRDDAVAAARIGLYIASCTYDGRVRYISFAKHWARVLIQREVVARTAPVHVPWWAVETSPDGARAALTRISLDAPIESDGDEPALLVDLIADAALPPPGERAERALTVTKVRALVEGLPRREAEVMRLRIGTAHGTEPLRQVDVGMRLGLSQARVGQIEASAMARMAHRLGVPEQPQAARRPR